MAEAAQKERWNHTAAWMALLANVNRDPHKGRPFTAADFHPFEKKKDRGITITKDNVHLLIQALKGEDLVVTGEKRG